MVVIATSWRERRVVPGTCRCGKVPSFRVRVRVRVRVPWTARGQLAVQRES